MTSDAPTEPPRLTAQAAWRSRNRDKIRAYKRADYQKNHAAIVARRKRHYEENREKYRAYGKAYRIKNHAHIRAKEKAKHAANPDLRKNHLAAHRLKHPLFWKLYGKRRDAKRLGIECDLTVDWIRERLDRGVCEMSGLPFDMAAKRGPNSPSIDRIDPKGPYTQANCRIILWSINRALCNYGEDYLLNIFAAVLERRKAATIHVPHEGKVA